MINTFIYSFFVNIIIFGIGQIFSPKKIFSFQKNHVINLSEKMKIFRPFDIYEIEGENSICVTGIFIFYNPRIYLSKNALNFIIYHELAHLKLNHSILLFWISVFFNFLIISMFNKFNFFIPIILIFLIKRIIGKNFENEADTMACLYSNKNEIIQMISLLNDMKRNHIKNFFIDFLFDDHPSYEDRIKILKNHALNK